MADTLDQFLRTVKAFYKEIAHTLAPGKIGIDQFLFPKLDRDDTSNFSLDSLIKNIHGVSFRNRDEQSVVRPYEAGTGVIYEPPRVSEKTPISEHLMDSVVAGIESTSGLSINSAARLQRIIEQHMVAHNATRWKLALDTIRTGAFSPKGLNGNDIGLEIDFGRAAGNNITYNFTPAAATIDLALKALYDVHVLNGGSKQNMVMILGDDWFEEFQANSDVLDRMAANTANVLVTQSLRPPELQNCQDLFLIAEYRIPGTPSSVYLCSYKPERQWVAYSGATAADFMPSDEAICFSLNSERYRVFRGVDVLDGNGNKARAVGELVFDSYTEKDPVTEFLRGSTRYAMIPGNVDHTARSTGTFPAS